MKNSLIILSFFVAGLLGGIFSIVPDFLLNTDFSAYALYFLMFFVGVGVSIDKNAWKMMKAIKLKMLLVPLSAIIGTFLGVILFSLLFTDMEIREALAVGSGFGYYSLSSVFGDYNGYGVRIENTYPGSDAKDRLAAGELKLLNNIWFNVNGFSLADSIGKESWTQAYLQNTANGNTEEEPQLKGISRAQNNGLDPRPATDGPAFSGNLADYPITSIEEVSFNSAIPQTFALEQNFPNPFNPVTNIKFDIKKAGKVELIIFNILGQKVATLMNEFRLAGTHQIQWNAKNLPSGTYIYVLKTANTSHSRKMLLMK
jgi:hypothetical protein